MVFFRGFVYELVSSLFLCVVVLDLSFLVMNLNPIKLLKVLHL